MLVPVQILRYYGAEAGRFLPLLMVRSLYGTSTHSLQMIKNATDKEYTLCHRSQMTGLRC